ncbi:MAG: hypothetical protein IJU50_03490 [Lachnospiraceae bacterium]|nr:hypothetical protein [Lachnospiraceae bacterium]
MRVYLDNCCYNRPYDDQTQLRISLETQAKLAIQSYVRSGNIELVTSYMTEYENEMNPVLSRKTSISRFQDEYSTVYVDESMDEKVKRMAEGIELTGIKHKDACHIACAMLSNSDYFISTDDRLLKYKAEGMRLLTPIEFINIWEDMNDDEHE